MTVQQFLLILRARYKVALIVLALTVVGTAVVNLVLPRQYTASASVVLDVKSPDPVSGLMLQGMMSPAYMATQTDIIGSDRTAKAVVKLLRMDENAAVRRQWQEATQGKGQLLDWLAGLIQKNMEVKPSRESNVITIAYTGTDPEFAATLANAYAQAYINVNLELRLAPARQYAVFFEEQSKVARERLENAQKALSDYQQRNGITAVDERLDIETAKLNETSSQLTSVQGQTTDSQSKRRYEKTDTVAEVMQSPLVNNLKAEIARLEAKLNESSVNLGKNHPQTQRTETELATLKSQLNAEIQRITHSIETTYQVNRQREQQLQSALNAQKARVLSLNKQRDELTVLRNDIESAQRAYEMVRQRASMTGIESQTTQTNIAVLTPAVTPTASSKPKIKLNLLVSVFAGTLLGVSLALALELLQRRVRSEQDLADMLDLPLLGTIGSAAGMIRQLLPPAPAQAGASGASA